MSVPDEAVEYILLQRYTEEYLKAFPGIALMLTGYIEAYHDFLRTKGIDLDKLLNDDDIHCPFCDEGNFDKPGLKWHLGNCHKFIKTELI